MEKIHIYEIYYTNKKDLFIKCDIKQPILILLEEEEDGVNDEILRQWDAHGHRHDLTLQLTNLLDDSPDVSIEFPCSTAHEIMRELPHYMTMGNTSFLKETGIITLLKERGECFKPNFIWREEYDVCYARQNSVIPFQYHTMSYKFLYILRGGVVVKMADFRHWDWFAGHPREPPPSHIEIKEIELGRGQMLYIPPYCMYSVFFQEPDCCLGEFQFETAFHWLVHSSQSMVRHLYQLTMNDLNLNSCILNKSVIFQNHLNK